jgi:DNA-binding NarL/FixJ family response regulator
MSSESQEPITVVVVEDDPTAQLGIKALLSGAEIRITGMCATPEQCLQLVAEQPPQVAVIDMRLAGDARAGLELVRVLRTLSPSTKCMIFTAADYHGDLLPDAFFAGARGYLRKSHMNGVDLPSVIKTLAADHYVIDQDLAAALVRRIEGTEQAADTAPGRTYEALTERERDVLKLVAQGLTTAEIADKLVITESTVKTHIRNITEKLQLPDRQQAAALAVLKGWINKS